MPCAILMYTISPEVSFFFQAMTAIPKRKCVTTGVMPINNLEKKGVKKKAVGQGKGSAKRYSLLVKGVKLV